MNIHGEPMSGSSYVFASSSADPLKLYEIQQDVKPVVACRGCLVTAQPLRPLDGKLSDAYGLLISPVEYCDIYPKYICVYCQALLLRFTKFRDKCLLNQTALYNIHSGGYEITLDHVQSGIIKSSHPLQITSTAIISLNPRPNQKTNVHETVNQNISHTLKRKQNNAVINTVNKESDWKYDVENISKFSVEFSKSTNEIDKNHVSNSLNNESDLPDFLDENVTVKVELEEPHLEENVTYESDKNTAFDNDSNSDDPIEEYKIKIQDSSKSKPHSSKRNNMNKLIKKVSHLRNNKDKKYNTRRSNTKTLGVILKTVTDQKHTKTSNIHSGGIEASHVFNKESADSKLHLKDCKTLIKSLKKQRNNNKKDRFLKYQADKREKLLLDNRKVLEKEYNFKTVVLSTDQQIQQMQERKESLKYKKARFKCELCYVGFLASETYNKHMDGHQLTEGNALCEVCSKCVRKTMMTQHIESKHKFDYVCNQCPHISKCLYTAKLHHRWHKGVTYDCKICGKSFDKQTSVMGHMLLSHKDEMISCSICDHKCNGDKGLRAHINLSHKEAKDAVCASCGVQFHSVSAMQRHRPQGDCDQDCRACAACGEGFANEELLEIHKSENHKRTDYICEICHRVFDDKYKYIAHVAYIKHKINKNWNESQTENPKESGKRIKGNRESKQRKNTIKAKNNGNEPKKKGKSKRKVHMCEICGSSYTNKTYFDTHCRIHAGEKPFICDYCGKGFASKFFVARHIQLHMGRGAGARKVHSCQYCHRQFSFPSNKLRHELTTHRGLVQFSCHMCGGTFTTKGAMQNHVRHTHEGVPWPKRVRKVL